MVSEKNMILFLTLLAFFCAIYAFISQYPGFFYGDSFMRIDYAYTLLTPKKIAYDSLSIGPSILIALCILVFKNPAFYTLLQAFLFFLMSFLFFKRFFFVKNTIIFLCLAFLFLQPPFQQISVFVEPSIWIVISILFFLIYTENIPTHSLKKVFFSLVLTLVFGFILLCRPNVVSIFPVFAIYLLYKKMSVKNITLIFAGSFCIFFSTTQLLIKNPQRHWGTGLMWDNIGILREINKKGSDALQEASSNLNLKNINYAHAVQQMDFNKVFSLNQALGERWVWDYQSKDLANMVLKDHLTLITSHPFSYLIYRIKFIIRSLGITRPLINLNHMSPASNNIGIYNKFKISPTKFHTDAGNQMTEHINRFSFLYLKPWLVFLILFSFIGIAYFLSLEIKKTLLMLGCFSFFYYSFFLFHTQSFELRYFLPSLVLSFIFLIGFIIYLINMLNLIFKILKI